MQEKLRKIKETLRRCTPRQSISRAGELAGAGRVRGYFNYHRSANQTLAHLTCSGTISPTSGAARCGTAVKKDRITWSTDDAMNWNARLPKPIILHRLAERVALPSTPKGGASIRSKPHVRICAEGRAMKQHLPLPSTLRHLMAQKQHLNGSRIALPVNRAVVSGLPGNCSAWHPILQVGGAAVVAEVV